MLFIINLETYFIDRCTHSARCWCTVFLRDRRPLPSTTELGICGKSPVPEVTVDERLNDRDERARVPPPSGTICKKDDHIFFFSV